MRNGILLFLSDSTTHHRLNDLIINISMNL
jgi:hypothetical protein